MTLALLQVRDLTKHFPITGGPFGVRTIGEVKAVDGVSFDLRAGETLALVGNPAAANRRRDACCCG